MLDLLFRVDSQPPDPRSDRELVSLSRLVEQSKSWNETFNAKELQLLTSMKLRGILRNRSLSLGEIFLQRDSAFEDEIGL